MTPPKPDAKALPGQILAMQGVAVSEMVAAAARLQGRMADAALRQNIETLDFLKARFEKDRDLLSGLAANREPSAALGIWSEFWQAAMTDYSAETGRLLAMMAAVADEAMGAAGEEGRKIMDRAKGTPPG